MKTFFAGLRPSLVLSLVSSSTRRPVDLRNLVGKPYRPSSSAAGVATLDFGDPAPLFDFLASETVRFASAAVHSYALVPERLTSWREVPWTLVTAYYSAFYAAHGIMRLAGQSCSFVAGDVRSSLRESFSAYGLGQSSPVRGLHLLKKDGALLEILHIGGQGGGVHEATWQSFEGLLRTMEVGALTSGLAADDAQRVLGVLSSVRETLNSEGCHGSWLSSIRNKVQYRQEFNVWHPSKVGAWCGGASESSFRCTEDLESAAAMLGAGSKEPLLAFVHCCRVLVSALCLLLRSIEENFAVSSVLYNHGTKRLLLESAQLQASAVVP